MFYSNCCWVPLFNLWISIQIADLFKRLKLEKEFETIIMKPKLLYEFLMEKLNDVNVRWIRTFYRQQIETVAANFANKYHYLIFNNLLNVHSSYFHCGLNIVGVIVLSILFWLRCNILLQINSSCVQWSDEKKQTFIIRDGEQLARLWGLEKTRPETNYDNFTRSLRAYYGQILVKLKGSNSWLNWIEIVRLKIDRLWLFIARYQYKFICDPESYFKTKLRKSQTRKENPVGWGKNQKKI